MLRAAALAVCLAALAPFSAASGSPAAASAPAIAQAPTDATPLARRGSAAPKDRGPRARPRTRLA